MRIVCGTCRACRDGYANLCYRIRFAGHGETDGMMRELMAWPAELLHPLPDAVTDALGVKDIAMPASPERVWRAIREAQP